MGQTISTAANFDRTWGSTLLGSDGQPTPYPADATWDASVWRGGLEAALFAPAVAWVDADAATFTLAVAANQTAALDPGVYRLQLGVTSGGVRSLAFDGQLEITDAPGTVSPPVAWCSFQDMLLYSDGIRSLVAAKGVDTANFLGQRAMVTSELQRDIVLRYDPRPGFVKTRRPTPHPILGYDVADPTAVPPTPAQLSAYLRAGGIILEGQLREIVARKAIALVLGRQIGSRDYMAEAMDQRDAADALFRCFSAQIDTDLDGTPDLLVGRDVILLPPGTSP